MFKSNIFKITYFFGTPFRRAMYSVARHTIMTHTFCVHCHHCHTHNDRCIWNAVRVIRILTCNLSSSHNVFTRHRLTLTIKQISNQNKNQLVSCFYDKKSLFIIHKFLIYFNARNNFVSQIAILFNKKYICACLQLLYSITRILKFKRAKNVDKTCNLFPMLSIC